MSMYVNIYRACYHVNIARANVIMSVIILVGTGRSGSTFDIFREDLSTDSDGNNPVENDFTEVSIHFLLIFCIHTTSHVCCVGYSVLLKVAKVMISNYSSLLRCL